MRILGLLSVSIVAAMLTVFGASAQEAHKHDHSGHELDVELKSEVKSLGGPLIEMQVSGLVCEFCAKSLDRELRLQAGVIDVAVDLNKQLVILAMRKGADLKDDKLQSVLVRLGYNLVDVHRVQPEPRNRG